MKVPIEIISELEAKIDDLGGFGEVKLRIALHDFRPRFVLATEKSVIPGKLSSGSKLRVAENNK